MTSILQPMDISVNKPFKDKLQTNKHIWQWAGLNQRGQLLETHPQSAEEVVQLPFREQVNWIAQRNLSSQAHKRLFSAHSILSAWTDITIDTIKNGWRHAGYDRIFNS
jgi:hypothetical protein